MFRIPLRLVFKNLLRHPVRSLLTVGSLTVALFLLCMLRSLVVSLDAGVRGSRSDRIIVQSAVSLFVQLPESYDGKVRATDGVQEVCSWNWFGGYYQDPADFFAQFAVDAETLMDCFPEMSLVAGSQQDFLDDQRGCIIGDQLAADYDFQVGDTIPIITPIYPRLDGGTWAFPIKGIYTSSSAVVDRRTVFFHNEYLTRSQEAGTVGGPRNRDIFVVLVADGADPVAVMNDIDAQFENGPQRVQSTPESVWQGQFASMVGNIPLFVSSLGGGVFLAILLAVVNTMLMAAREQTHDSGILKALGFKNGAVASVLLLQSLLLATLGGGLGLALARILSEPLADAIATRFPGFEVTVQTLALGAVVTLMIGLIAGLAPAIQLARRNVAESLRAEV